MLTAVVAAPNPNRAPTTGLVALSVNGLDQGTRPGSWESGFEFDSETCGDGLAYANACVVDTAKAAADNPGYTPYLPITVIGYDACTTLDGGRDRVARARRHLAAVTSRQVEAAFWSGEATDDPTPNGGDRPHLADGTAEVLASGTATEPVRALGLLDQALTDCLHGVAGMVHLTPYVLVQMAAASAVVRDNGRWVTPSGHTVVAGSGYEGIGPRDNPGDPLPAAPAPGADQWAYGTPMVTTLLGDVQAFGAIDQAVNTEVWRAERSAAAFHGACCKFAIQLELAT